MVFMVASDIHGSAHWCERLVDCYRRSGADRLLLLGDILYHGPRNDLPEGYSPRDVAPMLNALSDQIYCVRGNCDSEVDELMLDFPIRADYCLLPVRGRLIFATHGHVFNEDRLPPLKKGDILLHGHTHVPVCREHETYTCVNPGSVAIPKEDSWRGVMLITEDALIWQTLQGEEKLRYSL